MNTPMNDNRFELHASNTTDTLLRAPAIEASRERRDSRVAESAEIGIPAAASRAGKKLFATAGVLLALGAFAPQQAIAQGESASDAFIETVMRARPAEQMASQGAAEPADQVTATEQFVEAVLKGKVGADRIAPSDERAGNYAWQGPDLRFIYGTASVPHGR